MVLDIRKSKSTAWIYILIQFKILFIIEIIQNIITGIKKIYALKDKDFEYKLLSS